MTRQIAVVQMVSSQQVDKSLLRTVSGGPRLEVVVGVGVAGIGFRNIHREVRFGNDANFKGFQILKQLAKLGR